MLAVADDHLHVRGCVRPRTRRGRLVDLDGDDLADARGECERERPGPCADVERPLVAAKLQQAVDALGERCRALALQRRAPFQPAAHESVTTRRARVGEESMPQASSYVIVPAT